MDDLSGYLTKLASSDPTPGGGSAAMVSGSLACALVAMVARISKAPELAGKADALRVRMNELREKDEEAFEAVVAARGDRAATQRALLGAALAPLAGAQAALDALRLCDLALALGNKHLVSDVGCAAEFAHAALVACAYNVRINHKYLKDPGASDVVQQQDAALATALSHGDEIYGRLRDATSAALTD